MPLDGAVVFAFVDKDGKESAESPGKLLGLSVTIGWFRGLSDCKCCASASCQFSVPETGEELTVSVLSGMVGTCWAGFFVSAHIDPLTGIMFGFNEVLVRWLLLVAKDGFGRSFSESGFPHT